jgi:hypothetical protein
VSQYLSGSSAIVAFTRGTAADVDRRAAGIADGSFFANFKPTFGYGLGSENTVKIMFKSPGVDIRSNLTLRSGVQGVKFSYNGTSSDNRKMILVSQEN